MKAKVKCIQNYNDKQLDKMVTTNDDPFVVDLARAEELVKAGVCEIVEKLEEHKEKPVEQKEIKPRKKK